MPNFVNLPRSIAPTMSADIIIISVIGANGQPLPIYGNSIGSNWSAPVKQERADEAEIQELAAKMVETQKAALAKQQQQAAQTASRQAAVAPNGMQLQPPHNNGQTNILNYLSRQQKLPNGSAPAMHNAAATASTTNGSRSVLNNSTTGGSSGAAGDSSSISSSDKKAPCDEESQMGHFGWHTFGKTYIPYIFRQGQEKEKYCSVRMIELKLLGKYLNCLHPDIYSSCTCVRSYYITEAEARLLIEINHKHCDGEFGRDMFTQKDLVVRLSDATKFYQFLDICYRKLISGSKSPSEKCGFIRINKESVVPYTVRNNEQVVPLFYFEGETENLKQKADYLSGWDLAYLKFCCKVQGIRNELFSSENVAVISLTDIKSYFPNGTEFEDYWPSKVVDSNLLIGNRSNSNNAINWTRQPTQPPPKVMTQTNLAQKASSHSAAAAAAAAAQQQQMLKRGAAGGPNASYAAQSAAAAAAAVAAMQQQPGQRMHPNSASLAQATAQALTNSWMTQPLMHAQIIQAQQQSQHPSSRGQYRNNPMVNLILGQPDRQNYNYNNAGISMQPVNSHAQGNAPPPLVRSAGGQNANHMSNVEQTMLQQQTQQQQRHNSSTASSLSTCASTTSPSPYNFNLPSNPITAPDYTNLAFWNQLTPTQRLLLTQQIKNSSTLLGSNSKSVFPPPFPSLPLDTDLKTMLDYNPHKSKHNSSSASTSSGAAATNTSNGQFTKPSVPPLIPVNTSLELQTKRSGAGAATGAGSSSRHTPYPSPSLLSTSSTSSSSSSMSTVPLNSSAALEDFEKKFKMTDEMKAVVQKVLSNPDLSTFIQTNSSSTFVPFISPPISPAASLSIVPNPNVTITPHIPSHFSHSAHSPSSSSTSCSSSAAAGLTSSGSRQKSVICSTISGALNVPPSPSTSNSTSTPSPSPTRSASNAVAPAKNSSGSSSHFTHHNHHHQHQHHQQHHHPLNINNNNHSSSQHYHPHHHSSQHSQQHHNYHHHNQNTTNTPPMEVIDLSSPRRSLQAGNPYMQQHQVHPAVVQQQQRLAAAAQHHSQQNGRSSSNSAVPNSASMHLQRHALANAAAAEGVNRLSVIPELTPNNMNAQPYKVQKVYVDNHLVPCINMKAYNDSEQLMTLTDFQRFFFPKVPLENCKILIETLGVELYKGNRRQVQILMENDRNHNENIPLVQVRDIMKYMTQLTFMIRNQDQPPAKRTRMS